jgi:hypothetical protein
MSPTPNALPDRSGFFSTRRTTHHHYAIYWKSYSFIHPVDKNIARETPAFHLPMVKSRCLFARWDSPGFPRGWFIESREIAQRGGDSPFRI